MAAEALLTTRQIKIIGKKKFIVAILDIDNKIFVIYVAALAKPTIMLIYIFYEVQVALLTSIEISAKYFNFLNIFSSNSAAKLPEYIGINNYSINLLEDKQLVYDLIYSLKLVELNMLKTYIKANLTSGFIKSFKSFSSTPILFVQEKDSSLYLCKNYQDLNNLIIKNCYPLSLISKSLDCISYAKCFTQLDLINIYH